MAPSMMGMPMLPRVLPKPEVIRFRTSVKEKPSVSKWPRTRPINRALVNSANVG